MGLSSKKIVDYFVITYLMVLSISGVLNIIAHNTTRFLLIYKDIYSLILPAFLLLYLVANKARLGPGFRNYLLLFIGMVMLSLSYVLISILNNNFKIGNIVTQFRFELFTYSSLLVAAFLVCLEREHRMQLLSKIIKVYIVVTVINAIFAILESFFSGILYAVAGVNPGLQFTQVGKDNGLILRSASGFFRAIGLFSGPFTLAEFLFFGLILSPFVSNKHRFKYIIIVTAGIVCSTSKTAMIMAVIYFGYLFIRRFLPLKLSLASVAMVCIVLLTFFYITMTDLGVYKSLYSSDNNYAEQSILARILLIEDVRHSDTYSILTGAGYGLNGNAATGDIAAIPLDSIYIFLLSNYGGIGIFIFLLASSMILLRLYMKVCRGYFFPGVFLYWMISISINFVYNNPITNYPGYIFSIIISALLLSFRQDEFYKVADAKQLHEKIR
ncbi:hypothetical protein [Serratia proteamaculans]|uniref:O-antigen polymerase n=1 Tax=Serratia proteamaculans TaxID=28151 RepID=A0A5Q2V2X6_SERPR|nr:hypothetical protein [Serratia proteamaculans]QGH59742.1 hypothetical protein GHV41_02275 [Serratia proteamaculans]